MSSALYSVLVAMAADIEANAGLPAKHAKQLGVARLVETEKNLPLLNIFCPKTYGFRLTTDTYTEWNDHITIGWYTASPTSMENGIVPDTDVQAHLTVAEQIEQRAILWVPTIPGLAIQNETSFDEVLRGKVRGNVLGTEIKVTVKRWRQ